MEKLEQRAQELANEGFDREGIAASLVDEGVDPKAAEALARRFGEEPARLARPVKALWIVLGAAMIVLGLFMFASARPGAGVIKYMPLVLVLLGAFRLYRGVRGR